MDLLAFQHLLLSCGYVAVIFTLKKSRQLAVLGLNGFRGKKWICTEQL
jgi:hypothetical protein